MKKILKAEHVTYLFLITLIVVTVIPFLMMVLGSFKQDYEILSMNPKLLPREGFMLREYNQLFDYWPFWRNMLNSTIVTTITTVGASFFCALAGITFAKYRFPGKEGLFLVALASMMIPFESIVVPTYILIRTLGGLNTYWALIVPKLIPPFGIFLMRQYAYSGIPDSMLEAARIEGAGEWRIMTGISFPIMKPAMISLAILTFMNSWNDFFGPLILTTKSKMFTVSVALKSLADPGQPDLGIVLAAATLSVIPIFIMYAAFNKQMLQSMLEGSGK
ncbi:MAG: carbohydrate ABC transporter permease [Firmicutes bacterium]|nr:carbohydrate ABC transporter permease [Bacillota bacterium]